MDVSSSEDETTLNWLGYINSTTDEGQYNMIIYKWRGEIFCISTKFIPAYTELLIWYLENPENSVAKRLVVHNNWNQNESAVSENFLKKRNNIVFPTNLYCATPSHVISKRKMICEVKSISSVQSWNKSKNINLLNKDQYAESKLHVKNIGHSKKLETLMNNLCQKPWKHMSVFHIQKTLSEVENRRHLGKISHSLTTCNKEFSSPTYLFDPSRTHYEMPLKCDICNKSFSYSSVLSAHRRIHTGEICNKKFLSSSNLCTRRKKHTGKKPFACGICNKKYSNSSALNTHRITHTDEKPFECDICNRKYSYISTLSSHLRRHTGEKPFECGFCNKKFSDSSTLVQHRRIHTGEKPYECDICNKAFAQSSNLNKHRMTHTGEKPFECDICNKKFSQSSNLSEHKRTHR